MDNTKGLYDKLSKQNLYSKSYDDFVSQYGSAEGQKELFNKLSSSNLYSKSEDEFVNQYWAPVKKKESTASASTLPPAPSPLGSKNLGAKLVSESSGKVAKSSKPKAGESQGLLLVDPAKFNINYFDPSKKDWQGQLYEDVKIDDLSKNIAESSKSLAGMGKDYKARQDALNKEVEQFNGLIASRSISQQEAAQMKADLKKRQEETNFDFLKISELSKRTEAEQARLNKNIGVLAYEKSHEGSFLGAAWNSIVGSVKSVVSAYDMIGTRVLTENLAAFGQIKDWEKDAFEKKLNKVEKERRERVFGKINSDTTPEYAARISDESGWAAASLGVTGSVIPFVTGSMLTSTIGMAKDALDGMEGSEKMTEAEKGLYAVSVGLVAKKLEEEGAKGIVAALKGTAGPVTKFASWVFKSLPKNASVKLIENKVAELAATAAGQKILQLSETQVGKAALGATEAVAGEVVTGGLQKGGEMGVQELLDTANGLDVFKNPDLFSAESAAAIVQDAKLEGMGSMLMLGFGFGAKKLLQSVGSNSLSDKEYGDFKTILSSPELYQAKLAEISNRISTEKITAEQGDAEVTEINKARGIIKQIPDNLPVNSQKEAFLLISENNKVQEEIDQLSKEVADKNPQLVGDVVAEIEKKQQIINNNNQKLLNLPKNAIQEQTTSEVPVQPKTGVSGEMAEGKPQSETEVPTEEVKVEEVAKPQEEEVVIEDVKPTEMSSEEWTNIQDLADRISKGEQVTSPEDLQLQQNYPKAIESLLAKKQEPNQAPDTKSTKLSDEQNLAIKEGIKKAEDLVKAFPKRLPLSVKEKAISGFQKLNQEYINADQSQKDEMIRQMNYALGTTKKVSSPSVKKVLGQKPTMILVDEMKSLKEKLQLQEKAAKSGMDFANKAKKLVNATLKKLPKGALDIKATNALLTALDGKADTPEQRSEIIGKVIDIFKKSEGKIAIDEAKLFASQLDAEIRGAKKGADFVKRIKNKLSETLNSMVSKGAINPFQQSVIFNGLKSNITNPVMLDRFVNKVQRVIEKADYAKDLFDAGKLKGRISDISKRKGLSNEDKNIAKGFTSVNPDLVTNLSEYIDKAKAFIDSMSAPKVVKGKTVKPKAINYKEFNEYLNKQETIQQKALNDAMQDKYDKLVEEGKASGDMSIKDIETYLQGVQEDPKTLDYPKSVQVLKDSKEFFEDSKKEILDMIKNGEVNKEDLPLIKKFIDMNVLRMSSNEAFKSAKALENFIINDSTANMGLILDNYTGALEAEKMLKMVEYMKRVVDKKIKIGGYKKYVYAAGNIPHYLSGKRVKKLSDVYQENWLKELGHLDNFGTTYFGVDPWKKMKEAMGYDRIEQGAVQTKKEVVDFSNKIEDKYKDRKNGENNFLTSYTANELSMVGTLYREATDRDTQEYFNERKKNIEETIEYLEGQEDRKEEAERLRDIYDKLGIKDATNGKEVFDKANPVVREALNDYINEYKKWFPEFARIAKEQYGIILSPDANYLPDFWEKTVDYDPEADVFSKRGFTIGHDIVNTKPAGNFIAPKYPDGLPRNADGSVNKFINFDFFQNNVRALTSTIGNVKTTPGMNQYLGFINSPAFKNIIKNEYSRDLFKDKMDYTIRSLTNNVKTPKSGAIFDFLAPLYTYLGKAGARLGLSSAFAASKQTLPLFLNTLTYLNKNSGKMFEAMKIVNDPKVVEWMNNMPYTISVRDKQAVTSIDFASQLLDKGDYSTKDKTIKTIKEGLDFIIDKRLVPADVYIARASWLAIYLNELKKLGVKDFSFDGYDSPESIKAAKEAERIIKKEHNQSMSELLPRLYSGKDSARKFTRMAFGPFSGYSMSMKDKIKTNSAILFDTNFKATKEEKADAAKSMVATLIEQTMFNGLRWGIGSLFIGVANAIDDEEEDEETKTLKAMQEAQRMGTGILQSFTGSLPFAEEEAEQYAINGLLDLVDYLHAYIANKEESKLSPEQEAAWKKFESGGEEPLPETYEEKQRKETQKKIDKPLRIFIPETEGKIDMFMSMMGGTTAVSYEVGKKVIFDNFMELYEGGYTDKYNKFHPYTDEEKQKIWDRMYLSPLEITISPTEGRSIQNKRKKNLIKNVLKREDYEKKMEAEFNKGQ